MLDIAGKPWWWLLLMFIPVVNLIVAVIVSIAIARAILADPGILILDEATSNLDTESEQLIQAAMADLLTGRTTFVIAHRLSTVRRADLILLMEEGRIVERGTHEALMQARGGYFEMVQRQAEASRDDAGILA